MYYDEPHWLYRIYDGPKGKRLLYIGVTNSLPRRISQHLRDKWWFPDDGRITFEMYDDRASVLAAEERAIRREKPLYNVQHNIRVEVSIKAEVNLSLNSAAAIVAAIAGVYLLAKWGSDVYAVRREHQLAERQGIEHELPKVTNPFTEQPPSTAATVFYSALAVACMPPPPIVRQGDPKSAEACLAWHKNMAALTAPMAAPSAA